MLKCVAVALTFVVVAGSSCAQGTEPFIETSELSVLQSGTLDVAVRYADAAIVFTVLSESEGSYKRPEESDRSYEIPRELTIRVDEVVWQASSSNEELFASIGDEVNVGNQGWWVKDGGDSRIRTVSEGKNIEVGESYLAMFRLTPDSPKRLVILSDSTMTVDGGQTGVLGNDKFPEASNMSIEDLASSLASIEDRIGPIERPLWGTTTEPGS